MKILCVIDSLGSGGAQKQIVNLSIGLNRLGHTVEMFVYYPKINFFRDLIENERIKIHEFVKEKGLSISLILFLRSLIKT